MKNIQSEIILTFFIQNNELGIVLLNIKDIIKLTQHGI